MSKYATANNTFAFNLLRQTYGAAADKVVQVSPFSVRRALTMAAIGSRNGTRRAFFDTFGLPKDTDLDAVNAHNQEVAKRLLTCEADSKTPTKISLANALWLKRDGGSGYRFLPSFIDANKKWFDATVKDDLPFDDTTLAQINQWCDDNTNGKIKKILDEIPGAARFFLTDALYMKTPALHRFYKANDTKADFTRLDGSVVKDMTFMTNPWGDFNYFKGDGVEVVQFPFGRQGVFNYYLLLPAKDSSLDALVPKLTAENWATWKGQLSEHTGKLALPGNEQEYSEDLKDALCAMGLGEACDDDLADFLDLCTGRLKIGAVKHKTFTKFTRKGFEGAAVTAVGGFECTSIKMPNPSFELIADRPYAWLVTGGEEILFASTTVEPKEPEGFADEADDDDTFA